MEDDVIRQKVEFYQKNTTKVFLKKFNGSWYMGIILEYTKNHLILLDKKVGEVFIHFSEINKIEPYKEKGE